MSIQSNWFTPMRCTDTLHIVQALKIQDSRSMFLLGFHGSLFAVGSAPGSTHAMVESYLWISDEHTRKRRENRESFATRLTCVFSVLAFYSKIHDDVAMVTESTIHFVRAIPRSLIVSRYNWKQRKTRTSTWTSTCQVYSYERWHEQRVQLLQETNSEN
jgi:hypothetical protein